MVLLEDTTYAELNAHANENAQLKTEMRRAEAELERLRRENEILREHYALSRQRQFGTSSEKTPTGQEMLFNEAEVCASSEETPSETEVITYTRHKPKAKGKRDQDIAGLRVKEIKYELPENERVCPACTGPLHEMGQDTRQEIEVIPASIVVVKHISAVYACRNCQHNATETPIITAPKPKTAFPKSLASPSAVAFIMNRKYVEGSPLYRLEAYFKRSGFELSRQTQANWVIAGAIWLAYVYNRMHEHLVTRDIAHADETVLQVLRETGRAAQTNSYMWLYRSGRDGPPICLYDYQQTRAGEHPRTFLAKFKGFLHADGYAGYNGLSWVSLIGCWAHARRKFNDVIKLLPPELQKSGNTSAHIGRNFCNRLFAIERDLKDVSAEERFAGRQLRSRKVLDEYRAWLDVTANQVLRAGKLSEAVHYSLNQWPRLLGFLADGRLEIDNNRAERSIKPFVMGRLCGAPHNLPYVALAVMWRWKACSSALWP